MAFPGDKLRVNQAALATALRGRQGPVARDLARRAIRVESRAKLNASGIRIAGNPNPEQRGPRVRTGRLRSSISWTIAEDGRGLYAAVGTNVFYAKWVELGSDRAPPYPFLRPALPAGSGAATSR